MERDLQGRREWSGIKLWFGPSNQHKSIKRTGWSKNNCDNKKNKKNQIKRNGKTIKKVKKIVCQNLFNDVFIEICLKRTCWKFACSLKFNKCKGFMWSCQAMCPSAFKEHWCLMMWHDVVWILFVINKILMGVSECQECVCVTQFKKIKYLSYAFHHRIASPICHYKDLAVIRNIFLSDLWLSCSTCAQNISGYHTWSHVTSLSLHINHQLHTCCDV